MNKRLQVFDIIRAAAALAVIAIHITANYMDLPLAYIWNHAVRFAVPLFVIISGFLLYYSDRNAAVLPARVFYKKRLDRILWPYIIWTCIYSLINAYFLKLYNPILFLSTLGKNLLLGTGYYHLYFLPIILQLYLLYPLLRRWMEKDARFLFGACLALTLTAQSLIYMYMLRIISLPTQYSFLYLESFPVWLFYFVFGMYAAMRKEAWEEKLRKQGDVLFASSLGSPKRSKKNVPLLPGIIWFISLGLVLLDSQVTAIQGSIVRPSVMLYTICSYFFFYALAMQLRQVSRPWFAWVSGQSFLIYLMHPLVLTILVYGANRFGHPGIWAGNMGLLGLYIITAAVTFFMTYVISHTPLARFLGGAKN